MTPALVNALSTSFPREAPVITEIFRGWVARFFRYGMRNTFNAPCQGETAHADGHSVFDMFGCRFGTGDLVS